MKSIVSFAISGSLFVYSLAWTQIAKSGRKFADVLKAGTRKAATSEGQNVSFDNLEKFTAPVLLAHGDGPLNKDT